MSAGGACGLITGAMVFVFLAYIGNEDINIFESAAFFFILLGELVGMILLNFLVYLLISTVQNSPSMIESRRKYYEQANESYVFPVVGALFIILLLVGAGIFCKIYWEDCPFVVNLGIDGMFVLILGFGLMSPLQENQTFEYGVSLLLNMFAGFINLLCIYGIIWLLKTYAF